MTEPLDLLADLYGPDSAPLSGLDASRRAAAPADPQSPSMGLISEPELAALLALTYKQVGNHGRSGVCVRVSERPAMYDLAKSVTGYCEYLRRNPARGVAGPNKDKLDAEKLRKERANAEKLEIANAKSRGELVPVAEVSAAWADLLRDVRAGLLAVPSRCGAELATKLAAEDVAVIDREIRLALERLADDR